MNWVDRNVDAPDARVEPRGNAIVITKQASGSAKIDPLMASIQCHCIDVNEPLVDAAEHFVI